jgi:hypothetical protein
VGFAALVATFWLLVATFRLILTHECPVTQSAVPAPAPAVVARPDVSGRELWETGDCFGAPSSAPSPIGPISKNAVVAGFNAVKPKVEVCYDRYGVPGTAMVNVLIAKSGRVSSAVVTGTFAGTPSGACVERAVKTARFPRSDGLSTFYPLRLR